VSIKRFTKFYVIDEQGIKGPYKVTRTVKDLVYYRSFHVPYYLYDNTASYSMTVEDFEAKATVLA
jgi:hypothetical protein